MNILMTANKKFCFGLICSLYSILVNTAESITLYLSGIETNAIASHSKLNKYIKEKRLKIISITKDVENERYLFEQFARDRFPIVSFDRILGIFLLKDVCDKLLYLDSDTIITKDISSLYFLDTKKAITAIEDFENKNRFSDRVSYPYFNSGVLLINYKYLLNLSLENLDKTIGQSSKYIYYPDQDILNILFNENKQIIGQEFNFQFRDSSDNLKGIDAATVLHYVGMPKPWQHRYFLKKPLKIYWKYGIRCSSIFRYVLLRNNRAIFYLLVKINNLRKKVFKKGNNDEGNM